MLADPASTMIDNATGYISVAKALDREILSSYVLEVEAVDGGIPPLSSITLVNVEISDVNDNPPVFSETNYSAVVQVSLTKGAIHNIFS